ncbi:MAG: hypothetical protein ABEI52_09990, partial [Halobacteriaceae archaeon]
DDWEYPRYERLLEVLRKNDVPSEYDVVIIDPNAKADTVYYMALYATPTPPPQNHWEPLKRAKTHPNLITETLSSSV